MKFVSSLVEAMEVDKQAERLKVSSYLSTDLYLLLSILRYLAVALPHSNFQPISYMAYLVVNDLVLLLLLPPTLHL